LEKDAFDGWNTFKKLFKARKDEWNAWKFGTPDPSVPSRIRRVAIRRTRKEVLPDLPTKMYRKVRVTINRATYNLCDSVLIEADAAGVDVEDAVSEAIKTGARKTLFEELSEARRELATAKTPYAMSLLDMYEEAGEPVVVFSAHITSHRKGWGIITGATKTEDRADIVRTFQEGKLSGLACTIAAGGVGITLTHAHQAIFIDMDWTPAMNLQAEDRLCRIGQTGGVVITRLIAEHPLDERLASVLIKKQKLIEAANLN
jgi:SNF2 family DNA or RNA helicase